MNSTLAFINMNIMDMIIILSEQEHNKDKNNFFINTSRGFSIHIKSEHL